MVPATTIPIIFQKTPNGRKPAQKKNPFGFYFCSSCENSLIPECFSPLCRRAPTRAAREETVSVRRNLQPRPAGFKGNSLPAPEWKKSPGSPPKKSIIPTKLSLPARDEWRSPCAAPAEGKRSPKTRWVLVIPVFTPRIDPTIPITF